ncbi:hypothetical protein AB6G19_20615 [Providencia manganoxydans]|uniref:Type III secretion target, IpaC/SipC family n=1 Tax=Providencia manganoxydans TaxID=2923283 RepID=A0ABX7AF83_9GAMM|nr:hypothetical protein [Providencia sp. PROV266]QQO62606.1 hypothetical protein JI723_00995 [Providencia manganoxydans]
MSTILSPSPSSISTSKLAGIEELAANSLLGEQGKASTAITQAVSVKDALEMPSAQLQEKPLLKMPEQIASDSSVLLGVNAMNKVQAEESRNMVIGLSSAITHIQQYSAATNLKIENVIRDIITEDNAKLEKMFPTIASFDESEIKQLSQAVNILLAGSAIEDVQHSQNQQDDIKIGKQSLEAVKGSQFIGIISSDILVELRNLLSQIKLIINTTDRQLQADFLKLKTQMVQSAADTTIQEGKAAFQAALVGFAVSMAMTTVGALAQTKQLHTQTKAINTHGVAKNNFSTDAQKSMELSRSSMVKTGNKSIDQQNALAGARHQDASNRSRLEADKHQTQLDRVTNETQKKSVIIETYGRLSDNLGQVVTAGLNQETKILEAHKIILQDIGDTARSIASDKEKQIDTVMDLMRKVFDILKDIIEGQIRTFQAVATRG